MRPQGFEHVGAMQAKMSGECCVSFRLLRLFSFISLSRPSLTPVVPKKIYLKPIGQFGIPGPTRGNAPPGYTTSSFAAGGVDPAQAAANIAQSISGGMASGMGMPMSGSGMGMSAGMSGGIGMSGGAGAGGLGNPMRQSKRLYVGNISHDCNEAMLADFFNSKMKEQGLAAEMPGDPILHVQLNSEKSYAFVEVSGRASQFFIFF